MSEQEPENNNLIKFIAATVESMRDQMATKADLAQMATKSDIALLEAKLDEKTTAIRGDLERVNLRLDSIERALRARLDQIETEMSRLRSVLYLLVKDKPDMLRLLGQTPPGSDEVRP